ncbi:long-chain-fatty-acid--CoA ligase [Hahella sp. KA22]|uniref:long-chain-fatty-acid--CoA ligase n=1 Tax=Hahella sp. KA22 TaxID=1628392 RepID=UPI000FDDC60B|nr:long-chain fatty acid--CoA ligase [Hahella sp. KA22]AZZ91223.1 long-chain fatty acid--CoA ligase [Hahella sp. KA22]QAY54591.1 long-chain-fatty-acid--CoA ligase [Hahella sp. KA22]
MLNLATILTESAKRHPQKEALVCGAVRLTYAQVEHMTNQVANNLLAAGIRSGDRVALSCPNLHFFPIAYFGIVKAGAVAVPLNVLLSEDEIAYHLRDSQARAYICFEGVADLPLGPRGAAAYHAVAECERFWLISSGAGLVKSDIPALFDELLSGDEPAPDIVTQADDTVVVLYTSGTTGKPKGAELTHANIFLNVAQFARLSEARLDDNQLVALPLFHTFGQTVQMCGGFYNSNKLVLIPRFDPKAVVDAMVKEDITVFCGVPTMYWALLHGIELDEATVAQIRDRLRLCGSGGSSLAIEILRGFEAKFQVPILEGYGLSETSPVASFNVLDRPRKPGSVGVPIWGVDIKVVDEKGAEVARGERGEIVIRGHNIMKGYLNRPEATADAIRKGWFHSGDIGYMDEDGYLFIVDRLKDMIIRGGYNVYPRELEETILTHPAVSLAAVVGVPDSQYGEEIKAFVILKEGVRADGEEIREWCKNKMAAYKYPRLVEVCDSLPMTATGKILKRELKTL